MNEERYEELADKFESCIDAHVEYETEHEDAGDAYSHLPREGGWDYGNGRDRLVAFLEEHELPTDESLIDELEEWLLDDCPIRPGHIFDRVSDSAFWVDSYAVGEVEDQYCLPDLARALDIDESEALAFAAMAMGDNRFCLRDNGDGGVLSYTSTDAVWVFEAPLSDIKERIQWWVEAQEEN